MPIVIPSYPSPSNVYVPSLYGPTGDYSTALIAGLSRNPKTFTLPQYCKMVPVFAPTGYFLRMGLREQGRVFDVNGNVWGYRQPRPKKNNAADSFSMFTWQTIRRNYDYLVPYIERNLAPWKREPQEQKKEAVRLMTARTYRMCTALTTASNWNAATAQDPNLSANHTDTATNIAGGLADAGTVALPYLKYLIDNVGGFVMKDSMGVIDFGQMCMLMNPATAIQISHSAEIRDYIKGSPDARNEIRNGSSPNAKYGAGLPSTLYGMEVIVERTVVATAIKGATEVLTWAMPSQAIVFLVKPGFVPDDTNIDANGVLLDATAACLYYEDEMTVETFDNPKDRVLEGNIVENTQEVVSSPAMGYYVSAATSAPAAMIA